MPLVRRFSENLGIMLLKQFFGIEFDQNIDKILELGMQVFSRRLFIFFSPMSHQS